MYFFPFFFLRTQPRFRSLYLCCRPLHAKVLFSTWKWEIWRLWVDQGKLKSIFQAAVCVCVCVRWWGWRKQPMRLRTGSVLQPASTWMVNFTSSLDGASFRNKYMARDLITEDSAVFWGPWGKLGLLPSEGSISDNYTFSSQEIHILH